MSFKSKLMWFMLLNLNVKSSLIPAVTHVDYSARIQTVHKDTNERFYSLIQEFNRLTNCPILVNTSFKSYVTSAVPLLVQNVWYVCGAVARNLWDISKIKLKTLIFLREFLKSASSPCPVNVVCVAIASNVEMCLKPKENQWILHAFAVLDYVVCVFVLSTTLLSIRDFRWTFSVSRGRFAFSWFNFSWFFRSGIENS